jgi:GntR family transcriptional regulator
MQIMIDKDSSIPLHVQITERIKIGLLFGELAAGDPLPSIRQLEQETGVGRAIIHKAYLELEECGIIELSHGKRATVSEYLQGQPSPETMQQVNRLIKSTLNEVRRLNMSSASFAKLLMQQAREEDRTRICYLYADVSQTLTSFVAGEISRMWSVTVQPVLIHNLEVVIDSSPYSEFVIITNYYRLDAVRGYQRNVLRRPKITIVPIAIRFSQEMLKQIRALPKRSKILLVLEDQEYERHGQASLAAAYEEVFADSQLNFIVKPIQMAPDLAEVMRSGKYELIVANTTIWEQLPATVRKSRRLIHPTFELDRRSLEAARMAAGVIA